MDRQAYYGHESQLFGVEEHRLVGGRGDGMRLLQVRNGLGLEFTVSADRGCDISRLSWKGDNYGFFSANGYVGPAYYDDRDAGWMKGFAAGFLTTCGLLNVGAPCVDEGEALGQHGSISHTPAEQLGWDIDGEGITITGVMNSARIFGAKLLLRRRIRCSLTENVLTIHDTVQNTGGTSAPLLLLYHFNMGYPLLQECSEVYIPSRRVVPRDPRAAEGLDHWARVESPQPGFAEQCYFHEFGPEGRAGLFNPRLDKGVLISFDTARLDRFTQWKLMDVKDYVLALEPANCHVLGRDAMRRDGALCSLEPGASAEYEVRVSIVENAKAWQALQNA